MTRHLDLPFHFNSDGHAATVEQGSIEDITNCVEATFRTVIGQRQELPDFGIPDLTFGVQPLNLQQIVDHLSEIEPRAILLMEQAPDEFDAMIARVLAKVTAREVS
jgi:hypothetical protein